MYIDGLKEFSEHFKNCLDLSMWQFELLEKTKYFSTEYRLKTIDDEIYRVSQLLDTGYPFTSYNIIDEKLNDDSFFETEYITCYQGEYAVFVDALERKSVDYWETLHTYTRAKMLEFLISEKKAIISSSIENAYTVEPAKAKSNKVDAKLRQYGFLQLSKVKMLSEDSRQELVKFVCTNGLPYAIAMLKYLGFIDHLETEHFKTKSLLHKEIASWFNSNSDGRAVKGNINVLNPVSRENKDKYTSHLHKQDVINDYQKLK